MSNEIAIEDFKHDTWYWYTHYTEGGVFYPFKVIDNNYAMLDGSRVLLSKLEGFTFYEAVMLNVE